MLQKCNNSASFRTPFSGSLRVETHPRYWTYEIQQYSHPSSSVVIVLLNYLQFLKCTILSFLSSSLYMMLYLPKRQSFCYPLLSLLIYLFPSPSLTGASEISSWFTVPSICPHSNLCLSPIAPTTLDHDHLFTCLLSPTRLQRTWDSNRIIHLCISHALATISTASSW